MTKDYYRPVTPLEFELEVKNSRFIACLAPASSDQQANDFLKAIQLRWPKANHYCTASIVGSPYDDRVLTCSDDGEPSGTAGRPMLMVLQNRPIGEIAAVVVRYFGGVKLGTGGLQRAYSQAVSDALANVQTELRVYRETFRVSYPYSDQGAIETLWNKCDVKIISSDFGAEVEQRLALIPAQALDLQTKLDAATQGRVKLLEEHGARLK
ncbi:MAG: YigZ family protein [Pseudomonadota bacterium]